MSEAEKFGPLHGALLLKVASDSVASGLAHGRALAVNEEDYPEDLRAVRATFVTLTIGGELRGCIGTLSARQALVKDVAEHAYEAAFGDSRFPPLRKEEFPGLEYHLSILSPMEPLAVKSEEELLKILRPGVDGLIIEEGFHRATFLPSVWESLPDPKDFLGKLKRKAGLREKHWSSAMKVFRYVAEGIP